MKRKTVDIEIIREAIADYMRSEGCSCCENTEKHKEAKKKIAKLLYVPEYEDGSGYDFYKFSTLYSETT